MSDFEPSTILAGDTVKWDKTLDEYPPSGSWQLNYYLRARSSATLITLAWGSVITGAASTFNIVIPAATTAAWAVDDYGIFGEVSKAGERFNIFSGSLSVKVNPSATAAAYDGRTSARKTLDALESMLQGNASREERMIQISGPGFSRQLDLLSPEQLIKAHVYWTRIVKDEETSARVAAGMGTGRKILTRFK